MDSELLTTAPRGQGLEIEIEMNAFDLHQAAFDSACDEYAEETVEYVQQYADGAFDIFVSEEVCKAILACRAAWKEALRSSQTAQDCLRVDLIERPLSAVELQ